MRVKPCLRLKPVYDLEYTFTFHSPGIEPWILGLLKQVKPESVLDVGCGLGFWGLVLKGYLGASRIVGIDVDRNKVEFAKRLGVYDEVYVSDIRAFSYAGAFDAIIAIEPIHGVLDPGLLRRLEGLVKQGGIIVMALPGVQSADQLVKAGYVVFRYLLRGFVMVRVDRPEVCTAPGRIWRALAPLIKALHPALKLGGLLKRGI